MTTPQQFNHWMADCETLGTMPNRNPIIQLSLVPFDLETLTIGKGISLGFDYRTQTNRVTDPATVKWWQSKPQTVKDTLSQQMFDGRETRDKLIELNQFVLGQIDNSKPIIFWSKPSGFDYPFMEGIYKDNCASSPFPFWLVRDMGSHCIGRLGGDWDAMTQYHALKAQRNQDTAHDAMADCLWQLEWLFNVERHVREKQK